MFKKIKMFIIVFWMSSIYIKWIDLLGPIVLIEDKLLVSSFRAKDGFDISYSMGWYRMQLLSMWKLSKYFRFLRKAPMFGARITGITGKCCDDPLIQELIVHTLRHTLLSHENELPIGAIIDSAFRFVSDIYMNNTTQQFIDSSLKKMEHDKNKLSAAGLLDR